MSEKKRTTYKTGSKLDLPKHIDKKKYGYRWVSDTRLKERSDGYEERGYEVDKDEEGKVTKVGDLVLCRMPVDMHEARKEEIDAARENRLNRHFEAQQAQMDEMNSAIKRLGGKTKFKFESTE